MKRTKRIAYLVSTALIFVFGFFIFGLMANSMPHMPSFLVSGLTGGFLLGGMANGFFFFVHYIPKMSQGFKIACVVLFPFTLMAFFSTGAITLLPYQIYNLVKILSKPKDTVLIESALPGGHWL